MQHILGLEICADILVGDEMKRGLSGGQKKRLTTGEMLAGPAKSFFLDEISTGLDSSTTFQIVRFMRQMVHIMDVTMIIALFQPAPETYELFDDIILLSEGEIVYQGPRESVLHFFESVGFKCPERKGVADFLQEITSKKDQEQYWFRRDIPYQHGISKWELFKACFSREWLLMKRNYFLYIFKTFQITMMALIAMFFRQLLAFFCVNQMALSLFRFIAAVGRTKVVAHILGSITILVVSVLSGVTVSRTKQQLFFILSISYSRDLILSLSCEIFTYDYGQNAIAINEFLDKRWSAKNIDPRIPEPTDGKAFLNARGIFTEDYWYWISVAALIGFSLLFNIFFHSGSILFESRALLHAFGNSKAIIKEDEDQKKSTFASSSVENMATGTTEHSSASVGNSFEVSLVICCQEMKKQGIEENKLQLLRDISGAFRPGILTTLVGVSGAGKTTLMDVLAGRKTGGYIEGSISISGYPKNQATFARISGYCEQNDIYIPQMLQFTNLLCFLLGCVSVTRLIRKHERYVPILQMFIEEILELVELHSVRHFIVGLPGINGLSTEQRKRLTIAVELVANPSIIFMDEPTTGLDARAAAVVMRTVRNTVDRGRTVVCTIHQPSIDIFENLLLMKIGGQVIYGGPLGRNSQNLIEYFEGITGVPKIKDGYNPATWMLEITASVFESQLNLDFAELYAKSDLYQKNQELIKEICTPVPGTKDLYFPTKYSQSFVSQCKACFWKQNCSYWRNPEYNAIRFFVTIFIGINIYEKYIFIRLM
ncbi:hypothetical protein V8G54_028085 [Vigna mungo]|uniref:ABC transporter domain-containing protein n=1 Tax=Vigna mungo TaxID=3915 RepID=A0AAQ3MQT3_VIGMU